MKLFLNFKNHKLNHKIKNKQINKKIMKMILIVENQEIK
jgi:hypothetical protein